MEDGTRSQGSDAENGENAAEEDDDDNDTDGERDDSDDEGKAAKPKAITIPV